jgi:hypothetical protein
LPRLWRALGVLLLGYVALSFAGAGIDGGAPELGAARSSSVKHFIDSSMVGTFGGGYIEFVAVLLFVGAALLAARLLRGDGEVSAWLSSIMAATAVLSAAAVLTAQAVQAAAVYDGHHGAAVGTLTVLNDAGDVAFFLSIAVQGAFLISVGCAGLTTRALPSWIAFSGMAVGVVCLAAPLGSSVGVQQVGFLLQSVWLVVLAVYSVRRHVATTVTLPRRDSVAV